MPRRSKVGPYGAVSFTFKGNPYRCIEGLPEPSEYRLYLAATHHVDQWLKGLRRNRPDVLQRLANSGTGADLQRAFKEAAEKDPAWNVDPDEISLVYGAACDLSPEQLLEMLREFVPEMGLKANRQLPQQTFIEARNTAMAIADNRDDSPRMRREAVPGECALRRVFTGGPEIKFVPSGHLRDSGLSTELIFRELQHCNQEAVICFHIVLGMAILSRYPVPLDFGDLIRRLKWSWRSVREKRHLYKVLWRWLVVFDSLWVIGCRDGVYKHPVTKEPLDLHSNDALIKITGVLYQNQWSDGEFDPTPVEVTIVAGPWIDRLRDFRHVLANIGDIDRIASILSRP